MRSTITTVTFHKPFAMAGVDGRHPPGTYEVMTDEEELPGVSFVAWRRVRTSMRLPSLGTASAQEQWVTIQPEELSRNLEADRQMPQE